VSSPESGDFDEPERSRRREADVDGVPVVLPRAAQTESQLPSLVPIALCHVVPGMRDEAAEGRRKTPSGSCG